MALDPIAKELRELADAIEKLCNASPCMSVAGSIVRNCCDHLCAVAATIEKRDREPHTSA